MTQYHLGVELPDITSEGYVNNCKQNCIKTKMAATNTVNALRIFQKMDALISGSDNIYSFGASDDYFKAFDSLDDMLKVIETTEKFAAAKSINRKPPWSIQKIYLCATS